MVLKNPPKGTKIKEYTFNKLTNDILFVLNVKLSAHDISIVTSEKENTFGAYLISEYEKAQKRLEEEQKYNEVNAKYFKEFLESKQEYLSIMQLTELYKVICLFIRERMIFIENILA